MKKIIIDEINIRMISNFIKHYNFQIINIDDVNNNDDIYYITFDFKYIDTLLKKTNNIFIINLEQLSIYMNKDNLKFANEKRLLQYFIKIKNYLNNEKIKIIDYSYENKELWDKIFNYKIEKVLVPFFNKNELNIKKEINFVSLVNSQYREIYVEKYLNKINYTNFDGMWDNDRKELLKKSKILINIHAGDNYKICELFRINEALSYNVIVISQKCYNHELIDNKDKIIFCDDKDIQDKCIEVINNYEYYYNKFFS
jgi:hypothetical protein